MSFEEAWNAHEEEIGASNLAAQSFRQHAANGYSFGLSDGMVAAAALVESAGCLAEIDNRLCWVLQPSREIYNGLPRVPAGPPEEHHPSCPIALAAKIREADALSKGGQ